VYVPSGNTLILKILPLKSARLAEERWASKLRRPGRSSLGEKPSDAKGLVLSPVAR
jgi:hypothetical protein